MVKIKSAREIELMKETCRVAALTLKEVEKIIKPGISTYDIDSYAEKVMRENGAIPAEKGYPSGIRGVPDFPGSTCISINDEVIHGIPSKDRIIEDGDIVSVDLVTLKNGYNGDTARTYLVGNVTDSTKRLVKVTEEAFYEGLKYAKKGYRIGDISNAIDEYVRKNGYQVVREYEGHGIGKSMHEDPGVPNYGKAGHGPKLEAGMTIAIEPMVIEGENEIMELEDGWTVVTEDGSLSSHYENTVLITEKDPKVLTM